MSGSTTIPCFEASQGFTITVPGPIDDRFVVSSLSAVDAELHLGVRYQGMPIWIEDQKSYYTFVDGLTYANLRSFKSLLVDAGGLVLTFNYDAVSPANIDITLAHNLNSTNLLISAFDGLQPIDVAYNVIDANSIAISPNVDIANLRLVVVYTNSNISNPPQYVATSDFIPIKFENVASAFDYSILTTEKLFSIDCRKVSGTPLVTVGTTLAGNDLQTETAITTSDLNILINKTFPINQNIYVTVSGGVIDIQLTIMTNCF
jgi:hypothetical protein